MIFNAKKFLLELISGSIVLLLLILLVIHFFFDPNWTREAIFGWLISLGIFLLGIISINWSFHRSLKTFMGVVLGGMLLRFVLIGVVIFLFMRFTTMHLIVFLLTFFAFYFLYQVFEIRFIHIRLSKGKKWLEVFKEV